MARLPRLDLPGIPQHIVQRGVDRQACFASDDDRRRYLRDLRDALARHACALHAFVLMTNHVHLLMTPPEAGAVSRTMQAVGRRYVGCFNARYGRTGTLWEGRYKACPVDSERYVLTCYRYIELNPVRAGMVTTPGDFPWSSYASNANGAPEPCITPHPAYDALGATPAERQGRYRQLVSEGVAGVDMLCLRAGTQQQKTWGSDRFRVQLERLAGRARAVRARRRPSKKPEEN